MTKVAVIGGTGYLASIIKSQKKFKNNKYFFFSRKKSSKNHLNYLLFKKDTNILKHFDFIIHLAGPNQNQLKKNKSLIQKKNQITSKLCDLCLEYNIKLLYVSSMQVYKDYGKKNLSISSKINFKNYYAKSHYESEKIIKKKFIKNKNMFTILRMGNVFGFKKYDNLKKINDNIVHSLCYLALKKEKFLIKDGSIQRTFIPSGIFFKIINFIINKKFFKNSIINIFYKNLNLTDIAQIIQKRSKLLFNINVDLVVKKFIYNKMFVISPNKYFNFCAKNKKIYFEIDQILKIIKKNI